MIDLHTLLESLSAEKTLEQSEGYRRRRIYPEKDFDCFFAIDVRSHQPLLMLTLGRNLALKVAQKQIKLEGLSLTIENQPNTDQYWMCIISNDSEKLDIFLLFLSDLIDRLTEATSTNDAAAICINGLKRWQDFMGKSKQNTLSIEEQTGLYAELSFLRTLINAIGAENAIKAWVGPEKAKKDFSFKTFAVEVKATLGSKGSSIKISSERQLQSLDGEAIYLNWQTLERVKAKEETLNQIVATIRQALMTDLVTASEFEAVLASTGYTEQHAGQYSQYGFQERSNKYFAVLDSFPRLVENSLPHGISEVSYSIDAGLCEAFKISFDDILECLEREND